MLTFNKSVDKKIRATVRVSFRVSGCMFDWLACRIGKVSAESQIREMLKEHGQTGLDMRTFAVRSGIVDCIHRDDIDEYKEDCWDVYEGY